MKFGSLGPVVRGTCTHWRLLATVIYFALGTLAIFVHEKDMFLGSDDQTYVRMTNVLLYHGKLAYTPEDPPSGATMPALPFTLAGFLAVFGAGMPGPGVQAFRLFQVMLQTAAFWFLVGTVSRILNPRTAKVTAALWLLYLPDYWVGGLILTEAMYRFALISLVCAVAATPVALTVGRGLALGFLWGMATLVRPVAAAFPVYLGMFALSSSPRRRLRIAGLAAMVAVCAALLAPWWIRNTISLDRSTPLTLSLWGGLLAGSRIGENKDITGPKFPQKANFPTQNEWISAIDEMARRTLPREYLGNPLENMAWYLGPKMNALWGEPFAWHSLFGVPLRLIKNYHSFLIAVGLLGLLVMLARQPGKTAALWTGLAWHTLCYLPFICIPRYAYPAMPLLIVAAAYTIARLMHDEPQPEIADSSPASI